MKKIKDALSFGISIFSASQMFYDEFKSFPDLEAQQSYNKSPLVINEWKKNIYCILVSFNNSPLLLSWLDKLKRTISSRKWIHKENINAIINPESEQKRISVFNTYREKIRQLKKEIN